MYRNQARVEQSAVVACVHNIVIVIHVEAARVCRQSINSVLVASAVASSTVAAC